MIPLGNVEKALDYLEECYLICDSEDIHYKNKKKFLKQSEEMSTYIYFNIITHPHGFGNDCKYRIC